MSYPAVKGNVWVLPVLLILTPEFVVCDEAVSALDYAVRNKILKLLIQLKQEKQLTYLFYFS